MICFRQLQTDGNHIMLSFDSNDQAIADEIIKQLETKNYDVQTPEGGGGHNIAEEYVILLMFQRYILCFLVCQKT
jgi:hypothetical protein